MFYDNSNQVLLESSLSTMNSPRQSELEAIDQRLDNYIKPISIDLTLPRRRNRLHVWMDNYPIITAQDENDEGGVVPIDSWIAEDNPKEWTSDDSFEAVTACGCLHIYLMSCLTRS